MPSWWPFGRSQDSESPRSERPAPARGHRARLDAYEAEYAAQVEDPNADPQAFADMCREAYVLAKAHVDNGSGPPSEDDVEMVKRWEQRSRTAASLASEASD
jgi:hypothetical protein